jgi:cellulose 1,4-beta-cellobiosidase
MYVNPDWVKEVESLAATDSANAALVRKAEAYSTAIWLDSISKTADMSRYLDDALAQQTSSGQQVVTTFVVYDLPNRDCAANSSNGELTGDATGSQRYRDEYIAPIAKALSTHTSQRIALIIEPDSLPNLATNMDKPKCASADTIYRELVAYAIKTLAMPHVAMYVDAAHSGWLGWDNNRTKAAAIFKDVLDRAGGADKIRGFATNTANYTALSGGDGAQLEPTDPCPDELTYVQKFGETLASSGIAGKHFVIDTARNGRSGIRQKWGEWCNVKGAGLGERPRAEPTANVDAYLWVKPPGESDGTSDSSAARFDSMCVSASSATGAPQAGQWFPTYFLGLVQNANPPL